MENVDIEKIIAIISDTVSRGEVFRLNPTGRSMLPTITPGSDSVLLARADNLKKYDIVLYRRRTGKIILHRIIGFSKGKYVMCGDSQNMIERIEKDEIIAKVSGIFKGNDFVPSDDKKYLARIKRLYIKKSPVLLAFSVKTAVKRLFGIKK
ncbi:MAG: S24/S26 family peptidase [Clostridia bacterium]|nr:S24/S26 family peptidase [Clostridia bacterium]